jgi:hypothetical protein
MSYEDRQTDIWKQWTRTLSNAGRLSCSSAKPSSPTRSNQLGLFRDVICCEPLDWDGASDWSPPVRVSLPPQPRMETRIAHKFCGQTSWTWRTGIGSATADDDVSVVRGHVVVETERGMDESGPTALARARAGSIAHAVWHGTWTDRVRTVPSYGLVVGPAAAAAAIRSQVDGSQGRGSRRSKKEDQLMLQDFGQHRYTLFPTGSDGCGGGHCSRNRLSTATTVVATMGPHHSSMTRTTMTTSMASSWTSQQHRKSRAGRSGRVISAAAATNKQQQRSTWRRSRLAYDAVDAQPQQDATLLRTKAMVCGRADLFKARETNRRKRKSLGWQLAAPVGRHHRVGGLAVTTKTNAGFLCHRR